MRILAGVATLLLAALPTPAGALLLPCAMPEGVPLRLVNEQQGWGANEGAMTVRIERRIVLRREGGGWLLDAGAPVVGSSLTGPAAARLAAGYGGMRPMRLTLSADGGVVAIEGQADHWAELMARLADAAGPGGSARAAGVRARLAAMTPDAQRTLLAGFWLPHARFCGRYLADGEARPTPDGLLALVSKDDPAPVPGLRSETRFDLDPATGLARSIERKATPVAMPDMPQIERWRIEPDRVTL